ncbi:MAG TPA: DUF4466 family protein [Puia sp.]|nr:DUF4466 family protein [Puia sp.]
MQHQSKYFRYTLLLVAGLSLFTSSCKKNDYALPKLPNKLQNEAIKRTLGPNIVGQQIEFAYAMAIKPNFGKLVACVAEASIAGAPGTYMENRSFNTAQNGADVGVTVGSPAVTSGATTTVTYNVDTSAATLRYYYVIPEAARGKTVTIKFTATSTDGESISTTMGPYTIAQMAMKLSMKVSDNNLMYISIGDSTVYNAADAAAHAGSIDLVYLYRNLTTSAFNHALVAPAADPQYLPGVTLPTGVNRTAKLLKEFNLQDHNLAPTENFGIYIDDVDFQKLDLTGDPNFAINLKADAGVWVETADGKYRAYIFFNSVTTTGTATISMKRYTLK